jgi:membrane protein
MASPSGSWESVPRAFRVDARLALTTWTRRFAENNLLTYATAIALQLLVALAALIFLAVALLRPLGAEDTWSHSVAPDLAARLPVEWTSAILWSVRHEMSAGGGVSIGFGVVLSVWEVSGAVRAVMGALNRIYGVQEPRGTGRRFVTSFLLAIPVSGLLVAAAFLGAGAFTSGSAWLDWLERTAGPALLVYAVVALLVLVAPARRQPWRWVSAGSIWIVFAWLSVSAVFAYWIGQVIDLRSPEAALGIVLSTVGYLYASAIAFLVGAQIDQLIREGGAAAALGRDRS